MVREIIVFNGLIEHGKKEESASTPAEHQTEFSMERMFEEMKPIETMRQLPIRKRPPTPTHDRLKGCHWAIIGPEKPTDRSELFLVRVREKVGFKGKKLTWARVGCDRKVPMRSYMIVRRTRDQAREDKQYLIKTMNLRNDLRPDYEDYYY